MNEKVDNDIMAVPPDGPVDPEPRDEVPDHSRLDVLGAEWFDGLAFTHTPIGDTLQSGPLPDVIGLREALERAGKHHPT